MYFKLLKAELLKLFTSFFGYLPIGVVYTIMAYFNFDKLLANYYIVKNLSNLKKYLYCVWKR